MTWQAVRAAFDVDVPDPAARLVLVALAYRSGMDGRAWPSLACLCADTGYSRSTVKRALSRLVDTGTLVVIHKRGGPSTYRVGGFTVNPPPGSERPHTRVTVNPHPGHSDPRNSKRTVKEQATSGLTPTGPAVANGASAAGNRWMSTTSKARFEELADGTVRIR